MPGDEEANPTLPNGENGDENTEENGGDENNGGDTEYPQATPSPAVDFVPARGRPSFLHLAQYTQPGATGADTQRVDPEARSEIEHVLSANALALDKMPAGDRAFIARTVSQQTGVSPADAKQRVDGLIARVHDERTRTEETARKAGAYIHIWLGLALLFGLLVSTGSAVLARMEEEKKGEEVVPVPAPAASP